MTYPLDGVRVVDLTHALAGPICTYHLALLGADVIKIEPPGRGDDFRARPHGRFAAMNAGKRSVELDLRSDLGRTALERLVETADVLVENFRPGTAERLGLEWTDLHERHPRLISCSISGYGQSGPMRDWPAIEWSVQATSGIAASYLDSERSAMDLGVGMLDVFTGYVAHTGILAALLERASSGKGRRLDTAMLDAAYVLGAPNVTSALLGGPAALGLRPTMARYKARDGWLFIAALNPKWLEKLVSILGAPEILDDPRFATAQARDGNAEAFVAEIESRLATRDAQDWEKILLDQGIPVGAAREIAEMARSEHVAGRELITTVEAPEGDVPVVGTGYWMEDLPRTPRGRVPNLGADTADVLAELGLAGSTPTPS